MTELIELHHGRMLRHGRRCAALASEIGIRAQCSAYENRPLVCREFQSGSEGCIMVGRSFKLEPDPAEFTAK